MAIKKIVNDIVGRELDLYIRLNSVEASNHGVASSFLFRGFESRDHFVNGDGFLWEYEVTAVIDVSGNIWEQAYALIKDDKSVDV